MDRDKIMARLQEHYDFLVNKGHEVVGVFLQGSQNYGLDLYTSTYPFSYCTLYLKYFFVCSSNAVLVSSITFLTFIIIKFPPYLILWGA